VENRLPDY